MTGNAAPVSYPRLLNLSGRRLAVGRTRPEEMLDAPSERLDIAAAAVRLGLSVDAIRKRIARGTLDSIVLDGHRYVVLDTNRPRPVTCPDAVPDATSRRPDDRPDSIREQVEILQSDVCFLRDELRRRDEGHVAELQRRDEQHEQERAQWHERLREAHLLAAQRPALEAPRLRDEPLHGEQEKQAHDVTVSTPRPWWRFWER